MKDLIKDILQYLKENEEARERFNKVSDYIKISEEGRIKTKKPSNGFTIKELTNVWIADDFEFQLFL